MKILFITTGSQATYYATAPLASAARNAGHQVMAAAHEPWVETAEAIGLPTFCYSAEPIRHFMAQATGKGLQFPVDLGDEAMFGQGRGFARMGLAGVKTLLDLAKDWTPDVVVGNSQSYAAMLLAAHLKIPYVRQIEYLGIPITGIDPGAEAELRPEMERLGVDGLLEPDLLLDATPPSLRPSYAPTTAQHVRWIPSNPQRLLERWMYTRPEGRRRVLITSGFRSVMFRNPGWGMSLLVSELSKLDCEVLVAASPGAAERYGAELGDARVGWIPLDVAATTCEMAIHHGGATTATTFIINSVPQLIIPENPPEFWPNYHRKAIATAISEFGAGKMLWPRAEAPDKEPGEVIAAAAKELLTEPSYTERTQFLAKEIASLPSPAEIVPMLEALASR